MADCELIAGCIFFNDRMEDYPIAAKRMKQDYCKGDNLCCARYIVFKAIGRAAVPKDLFPGQVDRAMKVIETVRTSV